MLVGTDTTLHVGADGATSARECQSLIATDSTWICADVLGDTIGFAADGTELWREPTTGRWPVVTYGHITPVALVEQDQELAAVDPITGRLGTRLVLEVDHPRGQSRC